MSFQNLTETGLCQDDHQHTPTATGLQHVPPLRQLSLEGTNDHLLPCCHLCWCCYLCPQQRVGQGHCCEGLVGLLDIDGDLVRGGWRRWRWLLLQGQTGGKGEHRWGGKTHGVVAGGKHSPILSLQSLMSGIWEGKW